MSDDDRNDDLVYCPVCDKPFASEGQKDGHLSSHSKKEIQEAEQ